MIQIETFLMVRHHSLNQPFYHIINLKSPTLLCPTDGEKAHMTMSSPVRLETDTESKLGNTARRVNAGLFLGL